MHTALPRTARWTCRPGRRALAGPALIALAGLLAACSSGSTAGTSSTTAGGGASTSAAVTVTTLAAPQGAAFYQPPDPLPAGNPGDLLWSAPLPDAPAGSTGYKVLYRSTDREGRPIAVSGMILVPPGEAPPGGRPVVAWAHGTTGVADSCAPSQAPGAAGRIPSVQPLLDAGYVVAATDYQGLGTPGPHPYLVGQSEGRGVLDAARAARQIPGAGASERVAVFGHSQGGHAALFAGQLAPDYAPDLDVVGVVAAAPAAELTELWEAQINNPIGIGLAAYAFGTWSQVYGQSLEGALTPEAIAATERIDELCVSDDTQYNEILSLVLPLSGGKFVVGDPLRTPPYDVLVDENTPGGTRQAHPVLVVQGTADPVVLPFTTDTFVRKICGQGDTVEYRTYEGADHSGVLQPASEGVVSWIADRFAGTPAAGNCADLPTAGSTTTTTAPTTTAAPVTTAS